MTTRTTTRVQDRALANLKWDAMRAIQRTEGAFARQALADFREELARRDYSRQVALCHRIIELAKGNDE